MELKIIWEENEAEQSRKWAELHLTTEPVGLEWIEVSAAALSNLDTASEQDKAQYVKFIVNMSKSMPNLLGNIRFSGKGTTQASNEFNIAPNTADKVFIWAH